MAVWALAALAAVKAIGSYSAAKDQAEAINNQADMEFLKANEIIRRNRVNRDLLFEEAEITTGKQTVQVAGSGRRLDVSTYALLEETTRKASEQAIRDAEVASWDASMAVASGEALQAKAKDVKKAGMISALTGMGSSAATGAQSTGSI